jgi:hypothetical protein
LPTPIFFWNSTIPTAILAFTPVSTEMHGSI